MKSSFFLMVFVLLALSLPVLSHETQQSLGADSAGYPEGNYHAEGKRHRNNIYYAFHAGSKGSILKVADFDEDAFGRKWAPVAGGVVGASLPRFSKRLFLSVEANYSKSYYIGTIEVPFNNQVQRTDYEFRLSTFQVPLSLQLNLKNSGNTFYVKAGYAFNWYNSGKLKWVDEVESNRKIITTIGTIDLQIEKQGTIQFGAGYKHSFIHSIKIYGEFRYERASNTLDPGVLESGSSFQNLYFLIGLQY